MISLPQQLCARFKMRVTSGYPLVLRVMPLALLVEFVVLGIHYGLPSLSPRWLAPRVLQDFAIYAHAVTVASTAHDPYAVRTIGAAFLYPPPSLLVVAPFSMLSLPWARACAVMSCDILILVCLAVGVSRYYALPLRRTWWWLPLALFFGPTIATVHVGQINLLTEGGILLLFLYASRQTMLAGIGLSLARATLHGGRHSPAS